MDARHAGDATRGGTAPTARPARPTSRARARVLAAVLQGVALAVAVATAVVAGVPTSIGVLLVLVVAAAACVNRQALFTAELSVTAEASVVLCAVVLFRDDAPVLAPMVVGLAAGWLDSFHWQSRAWAPMAFNSGTRAIEALLAALAFGAVATESSGLVGLLAASLVAAVVFACVDLAIITVLLVVRDAEPPMVAAREVLRIDAVSLPLAFLGATVGLLGDATSAWIGAVCVFPAAVLPDAVLAARARGSWWRLVAIVAAALGAIASAVLVGVLVGFPPPTVTMALVALGLVAGVEVVADGRVPIAPALGAAVLLAVSAVGPDDAIVAAVVAAAVAASLSWSLSPGVRPSAFTIAIAVTVATAVACGLVVDVGGSAVEAGAIFVLGVVVAAPRRSALAAVWWSLPFVAVGASAGALRPWVSEPVTLVCGIAVLGVAASTVAWSGPPPWRSRWATRWVRSRFRWSHRRMWIALGAVAVVAACVGVGAHPPWSAVAVVALAIVVEVAAAMAVTRVRLWRFTSFRRAFDAALLDAAAVGAWLASSDAATRTSRALLVALATAGATFAIGASTIGVADRAESMHRGRRDRSDVEVPT